MYVMPMFFIIRRQFHQGQIGKVVAVYIYESDVKLATQSIHSSTVGSHIREKRLTLAS